MSSNIIDIKSKNEPASDANSKVTRTVIGIAAELFGLSEDQLEVTLSPADCQRWDSLNHLRLVTAFETEFDCRLSMQQIRQIQNLGDLVALAEEQTAK